MFHEQVGDNGGHWATQEVGDNGGHWATQEVGDDEGHWATQEVGDNGGHWATHGCAKFLLVYRVSECEVSCVQNKVQ